MLCHYKEFGQRLYLTVGREVDCFHYKFVGAAIEEHFAEFADLALNEGIVLACSGVALEYGTFFELARAGLELHADIRGNHRTKNGEILPGVHAKKDKDQRIALPCWSRARLGGQAARDVNEHRFGQQENESA
jgi:hypothetical protein